MAEQQQTAGAVVPPTRRVERPAPRPVRPVVVAYEPHFAPRRPRTTGVYDPHFPGRRTA